MPSNRRSAVGACIGLGVVGSFVAGMIATWAIGVGSRPPADPCPPLATDDNGCAVAVDDLRQVVLHYDDGACVEYVVHRDRVDGFIRGAQTINDGSLIGITVYRMQRVWPSSWTADELETLFGDEYAPIYDWSRHESTLQLGD